MRRNSVRSAVTLVVPFLAISLSACQPEVEPPVTPTVDMVAPGRLIIQGQDDNLYLLEHGQQPERITQDAHSPSAEDVAYSNPTWSPDGWLSYVRTTTDPDGQEGIELIARPPSGDSPLTILSAPEDSYIYGYWSPSACDNGPGCRQLAYLVTDNEGVALHLARVSADVTGEADDTILSRSAPFFYSWSADGQSMLWNLEGRVLIRYDVAQEQATTLPDSPGAFLAPAWSPTDRRLLIAGSDGMSDRELHASHLIIIDDDQRLDFSEIDDTPFYFEWSPTGSSIAWTSGGDPLDPVTISPADGSSPAITTPVENVVAFFWSPDGSKLAVVALEPIGEGEVPDMGNPLSMIFTWWVIDASSGEAAKLARFFPTPEQFDLFRNFDQYSQSHRVWSPDSRYIVYADLPERGSRTLPGTVRLLDTDRPESGPLPLMEGRQAIFSFD